MKNIDSLIYKKNVFLQLPYRLYKVTNFCLPTQNLYLAFLTVEFGEVNKDINPLNLFQHNQNMLGIGIKKSKLYHASLNIDTNILYHKP